MAEGFNLKVGNAMRRAFGYGNFEHLSIALYHQVDDLPEPQYTHRFCGRGRYLKTCYLLIFERGFCGWDAGVFDRAGSPHLQVLAYGMGRGRQERSAIVPHAFGLRQIPLDLFWRAG
jgi:hypothetical protein